LQRQTLPETMIYLLAAMAGEIGNNLLSMPWMLPFERNYPAEHQKTVAMV
jgi:hypothetical protein